MKSSVILSVALTVGALAASPAHAFLGGASALMGGGGGGGNVDQDVAKFNTSMASALQLVNTSTLQLSKALLSKDKQEELEKMWKSAQGMADVKEKNAATAKFHADFQASAKQAVAAKETQELLKNATDKKKEFIKGASFNYALGLLQTVDLLASGNNIIKGVAANPMAVVKVLPIKDSLPLIQPLAGGFKDSTSMLMDVMKVAGIKFQMPKTDSPPATNVGSFDEN
jgi:hypothetical protein